MAEPTVYLEKLSAFARILRMEGLPVSPRDTEDGAAILTQLGFADRETVKTALMTIYAKSREEQLKFSAAFDGFFSRRRPFGPRPGSGRSRSSSGRPSGSRPRRSWNRLATG